MSGQPAALAIRQLGPDDLVTFKSIRMEALRLEPEAFAGTVADWEALDDAEWTRRLTANPVFAAFRGSTPVGLIGLTREQGAKRRHRATVTMVYVAAAERGSGAAQALLDYVVSHALDWEIAQLELGVNAANARAIRFYERNGFARIGLIPNFALENGVSSDEILMARRIA